MAELVKAHGIVDGGKEVKPCEVGPTWGNSRGIVRRLDYIFFSRLVECGFGYVVPVFFSDHDLVHFKISVAGPTFGPGYWRLNTNVLEEGEFCKQFRVFFEGLVGLRGLYEGVVEWWEGAKARVRTFCSRYCRRKTQRERKEVMRLQRLMEVEYVAANWMAMNQQACDGLKARLRVAYDTQARSFLWRSRDEYVEQNEKCSAGFFRSSEEKS